MTLSLACNFVGPTTGELILARGRKRGGGRKIVFCSAEVLNPDGSLVAFGEGSFRYRTGGGEPEEVQMTKMTEV